MGVWQTLEWEGVASAISEEKRWADEDRNMTDEQILELVNEALRGCGQLRNLEANCDNGRVTLQGLVPTNYLKQVAQAVVQSVAGIRDIDNDIRVVSSW